MIRFIFRKKSTYQLIQLLILLSLGFFPIPGIGQLGLDSMVKDIWMQAKKSPDKAIEAGLIAKKIAEEHNELKYLAKVYFSLGRAYMYKHDLDSAFSYYENSASLYRMLGDSLGVGASYNNLGEMYKSHGNFEEALYWYFKSLSTFQKIAGYSHKVTVFENIGNMYVQMNEYEKALPFQDSVISLSTNNNATTKIGDSYLNKGYSLLKLGNFIKAEQCLEKSKGLYASLKKEVKLAKADFTMGTLKLEMGNFKESATLMKNALKVFEDSLVSDKALQAYINLGVLYLRAGNLPNSLECLHQALALTQKLGNEIEKLTVYRNLYDVFGKAGNMDSSLYYLKQYSSLKDKLRERFSIDKVASLEVEYKVSNLIKQREDAQMVLQNERGMRIWLTVSLVILTLLLIIFILWHFLSRQRRSNEFLNLKIELEKRNNEFMRGLLVGEEKVRKGIGQELHDGIKNNLAAIKMSIETLGMQVEKGTHNVGKNIHRLNSMLDETSTDVRNLAYEMSGTKARKSLLQALEDWCEVLNQKRGLTVTYDLPKLEESRLSDPVKVHIYRIVQELSENVIRHSEANVVNLELEQVENYVVLKFEDNGKGFTWDPGMAKNSMGFGDMFQRVAEVEGKVLRIETQPGEGVCTVIQFPLA